MFGRKKVLRNSLYFTVLWKNEKNGTPSPNEIFKVWAQSTLAGDTADFLVLSWDVSIMVEAGFTTLELQKKQFSQ